MTAILKEFPRYRCHKYVGALMIKAIIPNPRGHELHFDDLTFVPMQVDDAWFAKHNPKAGGYLVQYDNGYLSYSPAEAFEQGYTAFPKVVRICGIDCKQGGTYCNGYCIGRAEHPPAF